MELTEIIKAAKLARIELTEEQKETFSKDLNNILNAFNNLNSVDTSGLEPLVNPVPNETIFRNDSDVETPDADLLQKSAPEVSGHLYRVPPVV